MNQKKKHHYVAQTYLKGFCNPDGKVCVYSKDRPTHPWWAAPDTVGFQNRYYSQPIPNGGRDNNRLEDFFSSIEDYWPQLIAKIEQRARYRGGLDQLLQFAMMHRVRVPTARDAAEKMLAESVRMTARYLNDRGMLPPPPAGLSFEQLAEDMVVSIDPHKSIHAMVDFAKGFTKVLRAIGFEILVNQTEEDFITTDNPVIYFDPTVPPTLLLPYNIDRARMEIEFMFPLSPKLMLWGHSTMKPRLGELHTATYQDLRDTKFVQRANNLAVRFAHRMVFANEAHHQSLVQQFAATSPVARVRHLRTPTGRGIFIEHIFGKRESKPKWNPSKSD